MTCFAGNRMQLRTVVQTIAIAQYLSFKVSVPRQPFPSAMTSEPSLLRIRGPALEDIRRREGSKHRSQSFRRQRTNPLPTRSGVAPACLRTRITLQAGRAPSPRPLRPRTSFQDHTCASVCGLRKARSQQSSRSQNAASLFPVSLSIPRVARCLRLALPRQPLNPSGGQVSPPRSSPSASRSLGWPGVSAPGGASICLETRWSAP
eukprot:8387789-Pyramimonas_sp.AAC.1